MKKITPLLILIFSSHLFAQYVENMHVPCKPVSQLAQRYGTLSKPRAATTQTNYDVTYYDIALDIDIQRRSINGKTEIHFESTVFDLTTIEVDLASNMAVDSVYLDAESYYRSGDVLHVKLNRPFIPGKRARVGISYRGTPEGGGFKGFSFGTQIVNGESNGIPIVSTLSEPYGARTWWPCKDVPTDKADSLRVSITTDENLTAVANGMLTSVEPIAEGTKTWVWEHKYPITTYLVSIVVTEFSYWNDTFHFMDGDSMPLEYWVYPAHNRQTIIDRWNLTNPMMQIFNEAYGKYPFYKEKYGMAQFDWGGAMEHQTCSSMGAESGSGENTMAHELAHQWWGDLVTCENFHHIWINEGFATYSEALYWGEKNGEWAYHNHMASKAWDYTGSIYRNDTTSVNSIFNYIVYGKGAWVLHMLRHVVGDDEFFQILADFREEYKFSHASTEDFQSVAESVYGGSLEWFFDPWIYGTGRPDYLWSWYIQDPGATDNWNVIINLAQQQILTASSFQMPIDFKFSNAEQDTTIVLFNSTINENFLVSLDFKPTDVELDPGNWILKKATRTLDTAISKLRPESFALLDAYPNPFNPKITIPFAVLEAFDGSLEIYDMKGNRVYSHTLNGVEPGFREHVWNAEQANGQTLSSGIYMVRIVSSSGASATQKISLLK